jgi:ABC-type Fe3+/spermidine/putrescine transport system ATPase subunit
MSAGKIMQVATPTAIYEAPTSRYVADFIGEVTLIEGVAAARDAADAPPEPEPEPEPVQVPEVDQAPPAPKPNGPKPNAAGRWLHKVLFERFTGPLADEPKLLPAPTEETPPSDPASTAASGPEPDLPGGGVEITWAEGQPVLIATNAEPDLDGKSVTLALRPEKVAIWTAPPPGPNVLEGKVLDIAYLGNISTYHAELADDVLIKAQVSNRLRTTERDITWEDRVWVSFAHDAGVVLEQ